MKTRGRCLLIRRFALGTVIVALLQSCGSPAPNEFMAEAMCRSFITDRLKSPGSAKFSDSSETERTTRSDGGFLITGWVDSQNSFSALMRNRYSCSIMPLGNEQWKLVDLKLQQTGGQ
jgi:hypothetical protein